MSRLHWPWYAEFGSVLLAAMALLLASYALLVRGSFVGAWLNGRRQPRGLETAR